MSDYEYHLTYEFTAIKEGVTKEKLMPKLQVCAAKGGMMGACDALFFASILYPPDGSLGVVFGSVDGRPDAKEGALSDDEYFKLWAMLAKNLSQSKTLSTPKRELATLVFQMVQQAILASRNARE